MSWDSYIDNMIEQSKDEKGNTHIDKASIFGLDTNTWTSATCEKALKVNPEEAQALAKCFKEGNFEQLQMNGVRMEGEKYQLLNVLDNKLILAKKKDKGALSIQKSKTAMVIAHCPEGGQHGNTNKAVGVISDYLESMNF